MICLAKTKYRIELSEDDKTWLQSVIASSESSERSIQRANILLISDRGNPQKLSIPEIAALVGVSHTTVQKVRTAYGTKGVRAAVLRKKREDVTPRKPVNRTDYSRRPGKMTEENLVKINALMKTVPPEGHKKWTYRLLADECVKQGIVEKISYSTLSQYFKNINGE